MLQELLHRYRATGRWTLGRTVLRNFAELMRDRIEPVHGADVDAAAELAGQMADVEARDLLHAAVMARTGSDLIATADRGFERLPNLRRLDPADIGRWRCPRSPCSLSPPAFSRCASRSALLAILSAARSPIL